MSRYQPTDDDVRRLRQIEQWQRNFRLLGDGVSFSNTADAFVGTVRWPALPRWMKAKPDPPQLGIVVCEGPCAALGPDAHGNGDGTPGTPSILPDFSDNRYWVRLARCVNDGGSTCDPLTVGFYPAGDPHDITVEATNLFEDNCQTHNVRPGTRVVVKWEWDLSTPPVKRWFMEVADEGTCRSQPCKPPTSASSSSSSGSGAPCCDSYCITTIAGNLIGTFQLDKTGAATWGGNGWVLYKDHGNGGDWTLRSDEGDFLFQPFTGAKACPDPADFWTDAGDSGTILTNFVCGPCPGSSSGSSGSAGSGGSSASGGSSGSGSCACPPGFHIENLPFTTQQAQLTYDPITCTPTLIPAVVVYKNVCVCNS